MIVGFVIFARNEGMRIGLRKTICKRFISVVDNDFGIYFGICSSKGQSKLGQLEF